MVRNIVSSAKSHSVSSVTVPVFATLRKGHKLNAVISHNDGKVIKMANENVSTLPAPVAAAAGIAQAAPAPETKARKSTKKFSVSQMAASLGTSTSHIYNKISELKAEPVETKGKTSFYSKEFWDAIKNAPRRVRRNRRNEVPLVPTSEVVQSAPVKPQVAQPAQPAQLSLMERIAQLESQLTVAKSNEERLAKLEDQISRIVKVLGA